MRPGASLSFNSAIEGVGKFVDGAGVAAIVIGILAAGLMTLAARPSTSDTYRLFRQRLGRAILLGLELLVAADIIRTVAVTPTFTSAGVLAMIVIIRTFLSFSLEVELEGHWPWSRHPSSHPDPDPPTNSEQNTPPSPRRESWPGGQ